MLYKKALSLSLAPSKIAIEVPQQSLLREVKAKALEK